VKLLLKWANEGHTGVRVMLACEDYPSLKDRQISKIATEFPLWLGKLSDSQIHGMSFILHRQYGGGIISLRNLDDPSKYASSEYAAIAIDELTKNTEEVFSQLRSIIRWPKIDRTKFLAATNPGGIGHHWVRRMWIDREFPETEPEPDQFRFVQAFAKDNPHLSPDYIHSLQGLPPALRLAYLEGSWDLFEGQFFDEWRDHVHVIQPFEIPTGWKRFRAIDHGRRAPTACMWGAVDFDGRVHWYREYYKAGVDADVNARAIASLSEGENYWFTVMDSACFSKTGAGETISEIYERSGVRAYPSPKDRIAGWNLFHKFLRHGSPGEPMMVFFDTCRNAIRTIPTLVYDKNRQEDLDSSGDDHVADAVAYALAFMHEGKSAKLESDPLRKMLNERRRRDTVSVQRLNAIYSGSAWRNKPR
jgi:phage terminase large subunit